MRVVGTRSPAPVCARGTASRTVAAPEVVHNGAVPVRVLIVDDHESFRSSARLLLEAEGYEVVGEAGTGAAGLSAAAELEPDVVLLDVHLPDLDGFDVAARLTGGEAAPRIVITSSRDASDFGPLIRRSGALGFVPKNELSGEALAALLD